jgi:hypothetical protein
MSHGLPRHPPGVGIEPASVQEMSVKSWMLAPTRTTARSKAWPRSTVWRLAASMTCEKGGVSGQQRHWQAARLVEPDRQYIQRRLLQRACLPAIHPGQPPRTWRDNTA